jgi:hypothetical protein
MDGEFGDEKHVYTCSNDMSLGRSLEVINDSEWVAKPGMGESHLEADTNNMIGKDTRQRVESWLSSHG